MTRALRAYIEAEGAEVFEDAEALADDGETLSADEMIAEMREIIEGDERKHAKQR